MQNNRRGEFLQTTGPSRTWKQAGQLLQKAVDTTEGDEALTDLSRTPGLQDLHITAGMAEAPGAGEDLATRGAPGEVIRTGALSRRWWSVEERKWYDKGPQEGG